MSKIASVYEVFANNYDLDIWRPYMYLSTDPKVVAATLDGLHTITCREETPQFWHDVRNVHNFEITARQARFIRAYTGTPLYALGILLHKFIREDTIPMVSAEEVHRKCREKHATPQALGYKIVKWHDTLDLNREPGEHPELEGFIPALYTRDDI